MVKQILGMKLVISYDSILCGGAEECKASLKPNQNQYRCLDLYHKRFGNPVGIVVSLAPYSLTQRADYQILHLPAYALGSLEQILKELV